VTELVRDEMENNLSAPYVDKKRYLWLLSLLWPSAPIIGIYIASVTGWIAFYWLTLVVWFGVIPLLDSVLGSDKNNPPESAVERLDADIYYRVLTFLTVPMHYVALFAVAWVVGTWSLTWFDILGLSLSLGIVNGLALNTGHELGHKKTTLEKWLAKIVLAVVGYGHFFIEHNKGHHRDVATPIDPASSRFGENIYKFSLREIPGAWQRAWELEKSRLERKGDSVWSLGNEILQPMMITLTVYGTLIVLFGATIIPFLVISTVFGWWQLTSANYIEHYGLLRKKLDSGRYERCQPYHSWNSNHRASNIILFHLQRHSDHHAHPTRRYQSLRDFKDLPELPSGYPLMFFIAMFPPIWFHIMNPRVVEQFKGHISQANIDPDKRESVIRQYQDKAA